MNLKYPSPDDIVEMKARGYDSTTIEEAERRVGRWRVAQEICRMIESAFAGVKLGEGVGLSEAGGLDDYADAATLAAYRANDEKDDWRRIPLEYLNTCSGCPSFFDAEGMRFHLPAYLIAQLRDEHIACMIFCLTHLSDHCRSQFALLNAAQRAAVRVFLLFFLDDPDEAWSRSDIIRALDEYWVEEPSP